MNRSLEKLWTEVQKPKLKRNPRSPGWTGATWAVGLIGFGTWTLLAYEAFRPAGLLPWLIGTLSGPFFFGILSGLLILLGYLLSKIPWWYRWIVTISLGLVLMTFALAITMALGGLIVSLLLILFSSLTGGMVALLSQPPSIKLTYSEHHDLRPKKTILHTVKLFLLVLGISGLVSLGVFLAIDGFEVTPPQNMGELSSGRVQPLNLENPSNLGPYGVHHLVYGPGSIPIPSESQSPTHVLSVPRNRRSQSQQAQYLGDVDLVTPRVDGSILQDGWSRLRKWYWGFGPENLPLNGQLWVPHGDGPFPLILLVHGNHPMEKSSELGYGYLGELLASRGYMVASLDMNFLNLSLTSNLLFFAGLKTENDARAWLILEHLAQFHRWNTDPNSTLFETIDLDSIGLMGHSRGGEAVATAALFNRLPFYPDNSQLSFDYQFSIRGIAAIAPVDGQYQPSNRPVLLEDVNYLVIHGAQDMDVVTFMGASQYERVQFSGTQSGFKTSLYVYGANHGQFNTDWGQDLFGPAVGLYNRRMLMSPEDQQQIGKVVLSAFFEASLRDRNEYRQLFQDPRRAKEWLPSTIYLSQYHDGLAIPLATFEEDFDLTTATLDGATLLGDNLSHWGEQTVPMKHGRLDRKVVALAWDNQNTFPDFDAINSLELPELQNQPGWFQISVPPNQIETHPQTILSFGIADNFVENQPLAEPIDITLQLTDAQGETAQLPLSHFSYLQPQISSRIGKFDFMVVIPQSEPVFQTFRFELGDFQIQNPLFQPDQLREIRFIFDRTAQGRILINGIWLVSHESSTD